MNETITQTRPPLTKTALIEQGVDALDPSKYGDKAVTHNPAHGVSQVNLPQVVEVAKFMAVAGEGVPKHCRANVGICLRITFQAVEWQMSPFSVADMSYIVNDRLAYMSQLIHAVVEARAPLQRRLDCKYDCEGSERTCTVIGHFITGDVREYTTPKFIDIRVKNSPLWKDDPDQQLFYYASRAWARKWCPDVLLGVYTREEMEEQPQFERDAGSGLHSRLAGATRSDEGHSAQHAVDEINKVGGGGQVIDNETKATEASEPDKKPKGKSKSKPAPEKTDPVPSDPKTPAQYVAYANDWIAKSTDVKEMDARWDTERAMRNACGVTSDDRQPLMDALIDKRAELPKKKAD